MSCFSCFCSEPKTPTKEKEKEAQGFAPAANNKDSRRNTNTKDDDKHVDNGNIEAKTFNFRELATATKNFRQECLLGEGGFGRVYKGQLQGGQVVAVKQLDRNGLQGNKEFLVEVLMLSLLHHENLVNLIGYCADGEQRLLVYEYMPGGSLEDHLLDLEPDKKALDWFTRMKIAAGVAQGLEYLHVKANPPVIYRDFKSSNILLDDDFNPKLSDFGLAKLGPLGDKMHVSSRVMGTYGYCAPEYTRTGQLTLQSDVFSFGVVLLELISGRRAMDPTRPINEQNLVSWAQPIFKDPRRFHEMADPLLNDDFPERGLNQAVAIAAMCLQDEAAARPMMTDVVTALSFLSVAPKVEDTSCGRPEKTESRGGSNTQQNGAAQVLEEGHDGSSISSHEEHNSEDHKDSVLVGSGSYTASSGRSMKNSDSRSGRESENNDDEVSGTDDEEGVVDSSGSGHHGSARSSESRESHYYQQLSGNYGSQNGSSHSSGRSLKSVKSQQSSDCSGKDDGFPHN